MLRPLVCLGALLALAPGARPAAPPARPVDVHGDPLPPGAFARMGSARLRPDRPLVQLAFSPDGRTLVGVTEGFSLWRWSVPAGKLLGTLPLGPKNVAGLVWSPRGGAVAMARPGEVQLLDAATGQLLRTFRHGKEVLASVAFAPDGRTLAAGCGTRGRGMPSPVLVWDAVTGKLLHRLDAHRAPVATIAFSADGRRLLSWSQKQSAVPMTRFDAIPPAACVWEMPAGKLARRVPAGGSQPVFSPDGRTLALTGADGRVRLWDLDAGKEVASLPGRERAYLFLPGGKTLVAGGNQEMVCLWDARGKKVRAFEGLLGKGTRPAALSPDGKLLATLGEWRSWDQGVRLWDVATGREVPPLPGHRGAVSCVAVSGRSVISGGEDGAVLVWDGRTGKLLRAGPGHDRPVTAVACSPDGRLAASGDAGHTVRVWDLATGRLRWRFDASPGRPGGSWAGGVVFLAFRRGGVLACGSGERDEAGRLRGWVCLLDASTGKVLRSEREEAAPLGVAPGGRLAAFVAAAEVGRFPLRQTLLVRDLDTGWEAVRVTAEESFRRVTFAPCGKEFVVGSMPTREILAPTGMADLLFRSRLWERATGKPVLALDRGVGLDCLAFSPDGTLVAGAWRIGGAVRLVDADTGRPTGELSRHVGSATCGAFAPDGRALFTGGSDGALLAWPVRRARSSAPPLAPRELERRWAELASDDPVRARAAVAALAGVPGQSVPLIRGRLRPVAGVPEGRIEPQLRDLASDEFKVRERATAALKELGELAAPALRRVLRGRPPLDLYRRAERLLAWAEATARTPDGLRVLRATTVLERAATTEARRALAALARGAPGALVTEEARAALERLGARPVVTAPAAPR